MLATATIISAMRRADLPDGSRRGDVGRDGRKQRAGVMFRRAATAGARDPYILPALVGGNHEP